jgi:hypothetical protein
VPVSSNKAAIHPISQNPPGWSCFTGLLASDSNAIPPEMNRSAQTLAVRAARVRGRGRQRNGHCGHPLQQRGDRRLRSVDGKPLEVQH